MSTRMAYALIVAGAVTVAGCSSEEPQPDQEVRAFAESACAAMLVSTEQQSVRAGDDVEVTIDNVEPECLDQGETSSTATPQTHEVVFVQGDEAVVLGTFSEADGPTVTVSATIPADAVSGEAAINVEFGDAATVTVVP